MANRGNANRPVQGAPGAIAVTETPEQHAARMQAIERDAAKQAADAEKARLAAAEEFRKAQETNAEQLRDAQSEADNADAERDQDGIDAAAKAIESSPNLNRVVAENITDPSPVAQAQAVRENATLSDEVNVADGPSFAAQAAPGTVVEPKSGLVTKVIKPD